MKLNQKGAAFALALIVLTVVLVVAVVLATNSFTYKQNSRYSLDNLEATNLAEAGIDKAVATLNATGGNYNGETSTDLGDGEFSVVITNVDQNTKIVESTGYIPNKENPKSKKTVAITVAKGAGMSFNYGIQAGEGGFELSGGSQINGSVYSNGNITMTGGNIITGDVRIAGGTQPTADQQAECSSPNCLDYQFGKSISGENRIDVGQSFRPTQTATINKVSLKLKKIGSPANATVRILGDSAGRPNKNNVLTTGVLNANLVTTEYGFVEVAFATNATLSANTNYWIVIDTASNTNNYWAWQQDSLGSYTRGGPAWSANWEAGNPVWTNASGDLAFRTYMGGVATYIRGDGGNTIGGNVYANSLLAVNVGALNISKDAYYQYVDSGVRVRGNSCLVNNQYCHPNSTDPLPQPMPVSESNIAEWKAAAEAGGTITGNQSLGWNCVQVWGQFPVRKFVGNVTVSSSCNIEFLSPIYITGNLTVESGGRVRLANSYGEQSGVIVVDGRVIMNGAGTINGSGHPDSNMLVLSNYVTTSPSNVPAINSGGGTSSSILYALNGDIVLSGGADLNQITAKKVILREGAEITYDTGVTTPFFSSGPSGSFSAVKGSYQLK